KKFGFLKPPFFIKKKKKKNWWVFFLRKFIVLMSVIFVFLGKMCVLLKNFKRPGGGGLCGYWGGCVNRSCNTSFQ
ncbi:hypothetical protein KCA24_30385, partial [Escherichia coli]|nr:hypothetical protein [Escherichia coli]